MAWLGKGRKPRAAAPTRPAILQARPVRNPSVTWGPDARGEMVIHIPLAKKPWMIRLGRFMPAPDVRHIILDDIGADVWQLCDGETTIDQIRRRIAEKYQLNYKEAEASLLEHLKQLAKRKLIVAIAGATPAAPSQPHEPLEPVPRTPARRKKRRK